VKTLSRNRAVIRRVARAASLAGALLLVCFCLGARALTTAAGQAAAQIAENPPDLKAFVGTWKATFHGQPLATLILKEQDGKLRGTMNDFDLFFDKDGNLTDDSHIDFGDAELLNVRFKSGALFFTVIEKDQYRPPSQWKFVPLNAQEGELTPLLDHQENVPPEVVAKPIRLTREKTKP
jgi:hypothetical protein